MKTTQTYIQKTCPIGSNIYYSLLKIKNPQREAIILIRAFYNSLLDALLNCRELIVTRAKLQWWRDEIQRSFEQKASHPIMKGLQPHITKFSLNQNQFFEIINAVDDYLQQPHFETQDAWFSFVSRFTGMRELLSLQVLQEIKKEDLQVIYQLSAGLFIAENIQLANTMLKSALLSSPRKRGSPATETIKSLCDIAQKYLKNTNTTPDRSLAIQRELANLRLTNYTKKRTIQACQTSYINPLRKLWKSWTTTA